MGNHLMVKGLERQFQNITLYLRKNYIKQIGYRAVNCYTALHMLAEEGNTNPTYEEAAELAGFCESSFRRGLDDLCALNIITKSARFDERGAKLCNLYTLNDPDEWNVKAASALPDATNGLVESDSTNRLAPSTNPLDEPSTRLKGGLVDATKPRTHTRGIENITTSTSTTLFSLTPDPDPVDQGSRDQVDQPNTPTFASASGAPSREPHARVSEPPAIFPPARSDGFDVCPPPRAANDESPAGKASKDFAKAVRFWQRNCGQVGDAIEDALWGFYVKFGGKLLLEALSTAVTENKFGSKPSMRFVEVILTRMDEAERNAQERIALIHRQDQEPQRRAVKREPTFLEKIAAELKAERKAREEEAAKAGLGDSHE